MVFIEQDLNARFEKAIFNLLRSFNYIDRNVGLLISYLPENGGIEVTYKKLAKKTFDQKMKWFKSLLKEGWLNEYLGKKGVSDFKKWYLQAHEARKLRNLYVHSIWIFNSAYIGKPVNISSHQWMKNVPGHEINEQMSLDELEEKSSMVENTFKDFMDLRKKYKI